MHFIKKIIETPVLEDPVKNFMSVHRHFYRYSRGDFIGPALKISRTSNKITLKGTHEYEDLILEIVSTAISNEDEIFEIKGNLISGSNISDKISELGFNWQLKKSTGQTKNYKAEIMDHADKKRLLRAVEIFREDSYLLLSFNRGPNSKITTKKKIPQPSKKKIGEDDVNKRVQFCTGYINNTDQTIKTLIDLALSDFRSDLPSKWKTIIILNNYKITDIELPKETYDSRLLRIMAIRKGKLFRSIEVDNNFIEKQYSFVV